MERRTESRGNEIQRRYERLDSERPTAVSGNVVSAPRELRSHEKEPFTRYIATLEEGMDSAREAFPEMWQELRRILRWELRRRGLWNCPPRYLGIAGEGRWEDRDGTATGTFSGAGRSAGSQPGRGSSGESLGPMDELLSMAYLWVFRDKITRLRDRVREGHNVDGTVRLHLQNLLHDLRRRHDPLGARLYDILKSAIVDAVQAGELFAVSGGSSMRGDSLLATRPDATLADTAPGQELRPIVEDWVRDLMPELMIAAGSRRRDVLSRLRRHIFRLELSDISCFYFRDLLGPFQAEIRAQWERIHHWELGAVQPGSGRFEEDFLDSLRPHLQVEERDSYDKLITCVSCLLAKRRGDARTRRHLETLWNYLRRYALADDEVRPLSGRKLSEFLGIPRNRLPELRRELGEMIGRSQEMLSFRVLDLEDRRTRREVKGEGHD